MSSRPIEGAAACLAVAALALAPGALADPPPGSTPDVAATVKVGPAASGVEASSLSRSGLRSRLHSALSVGGGSSGAWVFDTGAASNRVLFASNARSRRILASNQKLFATAAALDRFGSEHRFRTAVYVQGKRIGKQRQIVTGGLLLRGDGDPALGTASFASRHGLPVTRMESLARAVRAAGIRRVRGGLRIDDAVFDRRRGIPATGFRPGPYLSPLSGLSFNSGYGPSGYARAPEMLAAQAFRRGLARKGVKLRGATQRGTMPRKVLHTRDPVARIASPTLASLAAATNKPSNNFFAEMLLKRIAGGLNNRGTTKSGARRVQRFARRAGTKVAASDGSGLGRGNRASPKQVGKLLRRMSSGPEGIAFRQSLPVAGQEGTLAGRMRGTAAQGRCRGKTGTLSGVSALSGYCTVDGSRIVYSILMNGVDATRARSAQDRMVTAIASYRR